MDKEIERHINDLETRLVQRFNNLVKQQAAREAIENKRIEKMIDLKIERALQKISTQIEVLIKAAKRKL